MRKGRGEGIDEEYWRGRGTEEKGILGRGMKRGMRGRGER